MILDITPTTKTNIIIFIIMENMSTMASSGGIGGFTAGTSYVPIIVVFRYTLPVASSRVKEPITMASILTFPEAPTSWGENVPISAKSMSTLPNFIPHFANSLAMVIIPTVTEITSKTTIVVSNCSVISTGVGVAIS